MGKTTVKTGSTKETTTKSKKKVYMATLIRGRSYRLHKTKQMFEYGVATEVDEKTANYLKDNAISVEIKGKDPKGNPIKHNVEHFIIEEKKETTTRTRKRDSAKDEDNADGNNEE